MLVSIIIPAYKKEKMIIEDVLNIYNAINNTRWKFEIIVVEDGQLDNTSSVFRKFLKENPQYKKDIKFFSYKTNHGKGYAVRFGMARAKGNLISFIDAGMEINPNGISMILEHMEWYDADIIVASKRHYASKTNYTTTRRIYSLGYYFLTRWMFGLKVTDTQTGLKVYKREVLEKVLPRLVVKEYAFDIELLAVAHKLGFKRIYDAPVEVSLDFATSKFSAEKLLILDPFIRGMLWDTAAIFYRMNFLKYYDDDNKRKWVYNKELHMRVNTGESNKK